MDFFLICLGMFQLFVGFCCWCYGVLRWWWILGGARYVSTMFPKKKTQHFYSIITVGKPAPQLIGRWNKYHIVSKNTQENTKMKGKKEKRNVDADRIQNETRQNPYQLIWQLTLSAMRMFLRFISRSLSRLSLSRFSSSFFLAGFYSKMFPLILIVGCLFNEFLCMSCIRLFESWAIVFGV